MEIIIGESTDIFSNLAFEDYLLRVYQKNVLYAWRSSPSIVYGNFQNPWNEINIRNCLSDGVQLARRQSGGGAVYHDLGNLNLSFIGERAQESKASNIDFIINSLKELKIDVYQNERNDILALFDDQEYKLSGSAFKKIKNCSLHHCTLLIDANISQVWKYLTQNDTDMKSPGVKSKRRSVINLKELNQSISVNTILEAFIKQSISTWELSESEQMDIIDPVYMEKIKSWENQFGRGPWAEGVFENTDLGYRIEKGVLSSFTQCDENLEVILGQKAGLVNSEIESHLKPYWIKKYSSNYPDILSNFLTALY